MGQRFVLLMIAVLVCMFVLSLHPRVAKAGGTIYVMPDGSVDPSTAPIQCTENTYTLTDNIDEPIVVRKDFVIVDGAGHTIQGTGSGKGIDLSGRKYVTIKNAEIKGFDTCVYLYPLSSNNAVLGNNITNCSLALWLDYYANSNSISGNNIEGGIALGPVSCNNSISENQISGGISLATDSDNNNISKNSAAGIDISSLSRYNVIVENNVSRIGLWSSSDNSVLRNTLVDGGLWVRDSYGNLVENNSVNGKPLVYLEGVSNHIVDNAGQVILVNCRNILVKNLELSNTTSGVQLLRTNNTDISGNDIADNSFSGISLERSVNNSISGNNITHNGYGVSFYISLGNSLTGNNIARNGDGVNIVQSSNNTISGNDVTANTQYGISLWWSESNSIFHNDFVENQEHVSADAYYEDMWDDGIEGNFWSNYTGVDNDQDGIGDSPHAISAENQDNHPLMGQFSSISTSQGYSIDVISNSSVEGFQYFQSIGTIKMQVSNMTSDQTFGFCRISIPHTLMNETYCVTVNHAEPYSVNYTVYDDGSNRWIYFSYEHSTNEIIIVPEFSPSIVLPLLVTTTAMVIVCRRRRSRSTARATWDKNL